MAPQMVSGPLEGYWIANLDLDNAIKRNRAFEFDNGAMDFSVTHRSNDRNLTH